MQTDSDAKATPDCLIAGTGHKYLPHIDGLRSLAVIPVLFFHAGIRGFTGGYVGVDVFFVISGYLITGIILAEKDQGSFSISKFYVRRSKRILPALFAMMIASYIAAWLIFLPNEMRDFARSLAATAGFGSNIFFWKTVNYFGSGPETMPLLHTWSLSLEEQFYIAFPMLVIFIGNAGSRLRRWIILIIFALSLLLAIWGTPRSPAASFYLLPTRAWELLLGTLVLFLIPKVEKSSRWLHEISTVLALICVLAPVFFYTSQTIFPGALAIIPCLGAAVLILFGSEKSVVGSILRHPILVAIGLISYPLYLWHWPVLVFFRVGFADELGMSMRILCLMMSFGLAIVSYFFIERPTRRSTANNKTVLVLALTSSIAMGAVGIMTVKASGFPRRFPNFKLQHRDVGTLFSSGRCTLVFGQTAKDWDPHFCQVNIGASRQVLLWGDSFAGHLAPGLRKVAIHNGWNFIHYAKDYCPPLIGQTPVQDKTCQSFNRDVWKMVKPGAVIIIAGRWSSYDSEHVLDIPRIEQVASRLRQRGARVLLVGASPSFGFSSLDGYSYRTGRREAAVTFDRLLNRRLKSGVKSAQFLDPMVTLCPTYRCQLIDDVGERYVDNGHLSAHGSDLVANAISKLLPVSWTLR